jgi:hypothetical protein
MGPYMTHPDGALCRGEMRWLAWCRETCLRIGATQPLTVGNCGQMASVELTEPISDFVSIHPYYAWNRPGVTKREYEDRLDAYVAFARAKGKDLLATETVWGAVDDAQHLEVMRYTLGQLSERRIGFVVHALQHSLVADLHYPEYGPVGHPEVLHFVNPDGSLRPGHEAFNEYC